MKTIRVIDSHTAGEPTRVVVRGGPKLGGGSMAQRLKILQDKHDYFRLTVTGEPRGSDVMVGALLCAPLDKTCTAGVIFFNNVGYLGMCGHGLIGMITTLAHLKRIPPGEHRIETPVGVVTATLHEDCSVSVANVASYRRAKSVTVKVPILGSITGDVAWGGNWFFLADTNELSFRLTNAERLTEAARRIRMAVNAQGFLEVDHIELIGPPQSRAAHSRNFVLCPGYAYDRSPCGTGTSAKMACLAADGKLEEGQTWVQESILGTTFTGSYRWESKEAGRILPTIRGTAFITSEATLLLNERDPFCFGIAQ
jgi:4-hydroxyproline epimerase